MNRRLRWTTSSLARRLSPFRSNKIFERQGLGKQSAGPCHDPESGTQYLCGVHYSQHSFMNKVRAFGLVLLVSLGTHIALAEGTNIWRQSRYDEFEKGTAKGVAISSDGRLELAPSFKSIFTSPSTYTWQVVSDPQGVAYLASGSPARVYRVTPDGKASIIFEAKELQVQALEVDDQGALYAATSPDGKVYKIARASAKEQAPAASNERQIATSSETGPKSEGPVDKNYESRVFFDPKT